MAARNTALHCVRGPQFSCLPRLACLACPTWLPISNITVPLTPVPDTARGLCMVQVCFFLGLLGSPLDPSTPRASSTKQYPFAWIKSTNCEKHRGPAKIFGHELPRSGTPDFPGNAGGAIRWAEGVGVFPGELRTPSKARPLSSLLRTPTTCWLLLNLRLKVSTPV